MPTPPGCIALITDLPDAGLAGRGDHAMEWHKGESATGAVQGP